MEPHLDASQLAFLTQLLQVGRCSVQGVKARASLDAQAMEYLIVKLSKRLYEKTLDPNHK